MTVGERIKQRREELNMSQNDLAKKMGITRQAVSKAELHDNNITTVKVAKFAKALDCSIAYLMGWKETFDQNEPFNIDKVNKSIFTAAARDLEIDPEIKKDIESLLPPEAIEKLKTMSKDELDYVVNTIDMISRKKG